MTNTLRAQTRLERINHITYTYKGGIEILEDFYNHSVKEESQPCIVMM